jgi:hypothetical protein
MKDDPDEQAHPVVNMTHHAQERQIFLSVRGTNTDLCRRCSAVGGKPTQAMEAGITDHVAQLIRGSTDEHFWSETYDRELRDVFAVQSELARSIAEKVQVTVTGAEHARLTAARPVAPEVYESYLKGRFALNQSNSRAAVEESIVYFERAIKMDPTFAPAYVGLAAASSRLGTVFSVLLRTRRFSAGSLRKLQHNRQAR